MGKNNKKTDDVSSFDLDHGQSENISNVSHIYSSGWDPGDTDGFVEIKHGDKYSNSLTRKNADEALDPKIKYQITNYADPIVTLHFTTQ